MDKYSPKVITREAYSQKLIENEENWLLMLNDRNQTSHVYQEKMAEEIAGRIVDIYIKEFELLLQKLQ